MFSREVFYLFSLNIFVFIISQQMDIIIKSYHNIIILHYFPIYYILNEYCNITGIYNKCVNTEG